MQPPVILFYWRNVILKIKNRKGHPHFFEAKVAVPHRGARPGPCGLAGEKSSSRSALRYFFLPSLDAFPAGERL